MRIVQQITPCLWFADEAEAAASFYTSVFERSRIGRITRYTDVGRELHGRAPGSVMTVDFDLDGQPFTALNGGPVFRFNEAISFQVLCETQREVDFFWDKLTEGGDRRAQQCGWLKDRFGVSWQVVPAALAERMDDDDTEKVRRVTQAVLAMKKLDLDALRRAFEGA